MRQGRTGENGLNLSGSDWLLVADFGHGKPDGLPPLEITMTFASGSAFEAWAAGINGPSGPPDNTTRGTPLVADATNSMASPTTGILNLYVRRTSGSGQISFGPTVAR